MLTIEFLFCLSILPLFYPLFNAVKKQNPLGRRHWAKNLRRNVITLASWGLVSRGKGRLLTISPGNECFKDK